MIRACLFILGLLLCGCLGVSEASAATCPGDAYLWTGAAGDGSWNTAGNWNPAAVPPGGSDVCLPDIGHSYTVTLAPSGGNGGGTFNSLTIGAPSGSDTETLDIVGQSYVSGGETQNGEGIGVTNGATINATGSLVLDATAGGGRALSSDTLGGPAAFGDSPFGGGATIDNYGHIIAESSDYPTWDEQLNGNVDNEPGGSITVASGSLDQQTSNTVTNNGTVTTDADGDYDVTSGGTNDIFNNDGTVANNGTFEVGGQTGTFTQNGPETGNPVMIESSAILDDESGAGAFTLEFYNPELTGTIPAGQTVSVLGASDISGGETQNGTNFNLGGATVTNDGTLVLDATADGTKALSSDTLGGGVSVYNGSLTNNGTLEIKVDDPAWTNTLNASVANSHSGTATVAGVLDQSDGVNGITLTNDGTVTLAPTVLWNLYGGATFTNAPDGTLIPQIASASSFGTISVGGTMTGAGTIAPALTGGYTPPTGQEFDVIRTGGSNFTGTYTGTFGTVASGFTVDYTHETTSPPYVGVVYHSLTATPPPVRSATVGSISSSDGEFTVVVSCPAGGAACAAVSLRVTVKEHLKGRKITSITAHSKKKKAPAKSKVVVVASGSAKLSAGAKETLKLRLNSTGRALLSKFHKLTALVTVSSGGKTLKTATVTLREPKKKKKK